MLYYMHAVIVSYEVLVFLHCVLAFAAASNVSFIMTDEDN